MKPSNVDLLIVGGKIVMPHGILKADVAVDRGRIVSVSKPSHSPKAAQKIRANGRLILPGAIDCHVHFRDPGFPNREDFESGTRAAAAGGITTVIDMPNTSPAVSNARIFSEKRKRAQRKALVNFGLFAGAGSGNIGELQSLMRAGAMAFKTLMMNVPPAGRENEFGEIHLKRDRDIVDVIQAASRTGLTHVFHAETDGLIQREIDKLRSHGRNDAFAHVESRPSYAEADAVNRVIAIGKVYNDRVHIAHMSSSEGVELVRSAKTTYSGVTAETCPHYLLLTKHDMKRLGSLAKIQPPLREKSHQESLWRGLEDGTIDIVCSDHSPFTEEEKSMKKRSIWDVLPGAPDMENAVPLMLNCVNKSRLSIFRLVEIFSTNVSKIFGLFPRKGVIAVGSDADITIVDLKKEKTISASRMQTKGRENTLFDGIRVRGVPTQTIVRGKLVMDEGRIIGKAGYGAFEPPNPILIRGANILPWEGQGY